MESLLKICNAMLIVLVLVAFSVHETGSLSFEDSKEGRENYYNFLVETRASGKVYNGRERELRGKCQDRLPKMSCRVYRPLCGYYKIIKEVCAESCGLCGRAYHPVPCQATQFGCCWDNITKSLGPEKEGCPACVDTHQDCKYLKDRCAERAPVRRLCPKTCGVQCEACEDDPYQAEVCSYYKMAGMCEIDPELMKTHCKKTCNLCHLS